MGQYLIFFVGIVYTYFFLIRSFILIIRNDIRDDNYLFFKVSSKEKKIKFLIFRFLKIFFLSIIGYFIFAIGFAENYNMRTEFYQLVTGISYILFIIIYMIFLLVKIIKSK